MGVAIEPVAGIYAAVGTRTTTGSWVCSIGGFPTPTLNRNGCSFAVSDSLPNGVELAGTSGDSRARTQGLEPHTESAKFRKTPAGALPRALPRERSATRKLRESDRLRWLGTEAPSGESSNDSEKAGAPGGYCRTVDGVSPPSPRPRSISEHPRAWGSTTYEAPTRVKLSP